MEWLNEFTGLVTTDDPSELNCFEQLASGSIDLGYSTTFDNGNGRVTITGDQACWIEFIELIRSAKDFIDQQLDSLEENGIDLRDNLDSDQIERAD